MRRRAPRRASHEDLQRLQSRRFSVTAPPVFLTEQELGQPLAQELEPGQPLAQEQAQVQVQVQVQVQAPWRQEWQESRVPVRVPEVRPPVTLVFPARRRVRPGRFLQAPWW